MVRPVQAERSGGVGGGGAGGCQWDGLPSDLAKNYKHYLYGHPSVIPAKAGS